jgi:beta-lactamase regulating signal transducer with metallopeptidase domain
MLLPWMMYALIVTAFIAAAAIATERVAKMFVLPTRIVWCAAIVAVAVASLVTWRTPSRIPSMIPATPAINWLTTKPQSSPRAIERPSDNIGDVSARISANETLAAAWLSLSSLAAMFLVTTSAQMRRRQRAWTRASVCGADVFISDGLGPAVVGFLRPVIALPAWAIEEDDDRLRLIIAHEREHLRAGDQRVLALAWVVALALPWNVIAIWMIARLRQAIEIDCDARVMRACRDVRAYGELLIQVSRRPMTLPAGLMAFAERPSNVERRIMALTTGMPKHRKVLASSLTLAAAVVLFVACEIPRPIGPGARGTSELRLSQPIATESNAPLPRGAAPILQSALLRAFPAVSAKGTANGQAVWFIVSREGAVVGSWVGHAFTEAEFRRVATQPAYDALHLVCYISEVKADNGAIIHVVWATDITPWEERAGVSPPLRTMLRDSIRVHDPRLYAAVPAGQAVYILLDTKTRSVAKIWAASAISDRKAQWEYTRSQFPERNLLRVANVVVTADDGHEIPVVYISRTPWAERYGS